MWSRRALLACGLAAFGAERAWGATGYAEVLAKVYGCPIDPQAAQRAAMREISRVTFLADRRLRLCGLAHGGVGERLRTFAADPRRLYADDEAGRARALADMNSRLARLRPKLTSAFGDLPIPEAEVRAPAPENAARGGYREPPIYYVDLRNIRARPAWTLPSVAFHETVPGHALQASVLGAARAGAYSEAWAIYAEQLAWDLGAYVGDPLGELGYLHWRLFRLGRVLADIGQGALGWSLDQAVAAMRELQGFDAAFVTIEADAARMRAQPGGPAAQGLGALAIAAARPRRRAQWPAFHHAILADGPWPCSMLAAPTGAAR